MSLASFLVISFIRNDITSDQIIGFASKEMQI